MTEYGTGDRLYDDAPCSSQCDTSDGTPIAVTVGATTPGIDFALEIGGTISGSVVEATTRRRPAHGQTRYPL